MRSIISLVVIVVSSFFNVAFAQFQPKNLIKHYGINDGISQGVVNSIVEDKESLIWFATEDGLNRFDGYSFKIFKYDQQIKKGLSDNFIQCLFKDSEDTLWISSRNGLLKFDPDTESFSVFTQPFEKPGISTPNDVSFIAEGSANNLWVAWYGNGFGSFNRQTRKFTPYNVTNLSTLSSDRTVTLLEDNFGLLWVGTQDGGLNVFKTSNDLVVNKIEELSDPKHLPATNIRCIVKDKANNIWLGTSNGLVVYIRQYNRFYNFNDPAFSIASKSIFSLGVDSNENLWIGTQGGGVYQLDLRQLNTRSVEDFLFTKISSLDAYDISKKTFLSIYEDSNKNLWAGTFGDGIYMISSEIEKFTKIQKTLYNESSVSQVSFYGICYDQEGNLWLGTDGNGLYRKGIYGKDKKQYTADGKTGSIKDNAILSAFCDSNNHLWFGTYSHGIFTYDQGRDSFIQYKYSGDIQLQPGGNDVRVIFEDSKNRIWAGTNRGGLCLIDKSTKTYGSPESFLSVLKEGDIRSITEDKKGNLWLGFYGDGLYRYNYSKNELVKFFKKDAKEGQLRSEIVYALNIDRKNKLWIGTAGGGLYSFDEDKNSLEDFTEKNGLGNNTIYSILIDNNDDCWVSTNRGISRLHLASGKFTNYEGRDGLEAGFNPGSGLYNYVAGYMCFGGTGGLNIFYPENMDNKMKKPSIMISGLQIFNKSISLNDSANGKPILTKVINRTHEITLNYDQSVITLEFIGLNYSYPEKNNYAYKLEGLDDSWNFVGHQHTATYRYLKPGKYTFKVKVSNQPNYWDDEFDSLVITVNPPFWRTTSAYILYFTVFSISVFLVFKISRKQLSLRKRLKIEKEQRKNDKRLAMERLTFFTEISHEFRTPLTLILGPIEEMLSYETENSSSGRKLEMAHRNAKKLLALVNKLLDYRKIESGNVILKIKEEDVIPFVQEVYLTFKDLSDKRNITFTYTIERQPILVWFDKEKLEMVLTNIISNSFKYIGTGNEINITVSVQVSDKYPKGRFVVKIKDNGIGIPKKHISNIFDWFYKGDSSGLMNSGIGLSLARKLVHLHKGEIFVESAEGKGSVFSVKIPLGNEHFKPEEVSIITEEHSTVDEHHDSVISELVTSQAEIEDEKNFKKNSNTLLIVEDDDEIRGFLKEYFEPSYKIFESGNGKDGLDLALNVHPDLIISDIMMPGMDGTELCRQLKNNIRSSHIPIILLTAKTSLSNQKEGIEIGADSYIMKPFSPEILALTVSNLLQSRNKLMRFYRNLFVEQSDAATKAIDTPDEKFLHSIYELLKANLDKPEFNINELADLLNISRSLVYKKVKMLTGLSPTEYVRSLKMQEAAKLLKSQQYRVFEVVYMVGFSDLKYFRHCFAKEFGVSPSDYMKNAGV